MTDLQMPTYAFVDTDITNEDVDKSLVKVDRFFGPGNYDLVIEAVKLHSQNQYDPTWYTFEILFNRGQVEGDTRTIKHFLLVPTIAALYNKPDIKTPLFMYSKFREFVNALGIEVHPGTLGKVVPKLFDGKFKGLVGKTVNVDIKYDGHHILKTGEGEFKIFERNGKEFLGDGQDEALVYPDRDSALADAASYNLKIKGFASIVKFIAPAAAEEGWADE